MHGITQIDIEAISPDVLKKAFDAFMSVPKSLTIRQGKVAGREQLEQRLRRAIAAATKARQ